MTLEEIHSLASGEVKGAEAAQLREALKDCPESQAELKWAEAVRQCLREKGAKHEAPDCLARAKEQVRAIEAQTQTESFVGRFSWAFVAAVFVFIFAGVMVSRITGRSELGQASMASLFTGLQVAPGAEAQPDLTLERLFGRVPFNLVSGFRPAEVAYGSIAGHSSVRVSGRDSSGPLVLLAVKGVDSVVGFEQRAGDYSLGQVNDAQAVSWQAGDVTIILVGDRSADSLVTAAEDFRR